MHHRLDQAGAALAAHLAHHAEIEVGQAAIRQGQQVAGVGVGVEEAMLQQLLQGAVHAHLHQLVGVDAQFPYRLQVGELDAVDPLHRQHPPAGGLPVDAGHSNARVVGVQLGEGLSVAGLVAVVHLLKHPLAQLVDQGHQIGADQAHVAVEPGGDVAHDVEIERDLLAQAWALHLHRHLLAAVEYTLVHLAQRRC